MLRQVTCIVVLGVSLSAAAARAQDAAAPALPALPAEVQDLKGKRVAIYYDLDLLGTGKPSPLHTQYVSMILQQAGASVLRGGGGQTKFDVVIFGESAGLYQFTPAERADPFLAKKAKEQKEQVDAYNRTRPKLEADAAAAGARVIRSADVAEALGIRATEAEMSATIDAGTRDTLKRQLPEVKFDRIGVDEVINFLRDVTGANIFVNWRALEAAGVDRNAPITLQLREVPLSEALDKLLAQAGGKDAKLGYAVRDGIIEISTDDDLKRARPEVGRAGS